MKQPYAPIVLYLCGPGNATPILPWRLVHGHAHLRGTALDNAPLGSGPYVVRRWQRGDRLELAPNPYYYSGPPHISQMSIRIVASATTALQMLRSREADAYVNADDAQYDDLRALQRERTEPVPIDGTGALIFNPRSAIARRERSPRDRCFARCYEHCLEVTPRSTSRSRSGARARLSWRRRSKRKRKPSASRSRFVNSR